jgi:hypothetical protein
VKTPRKIMNAARGEQCTLQVVGVCRNNPETVVACHLPDGSGGSNRLTGPLSIAFGCHDCHQWIDGGYASDETYKDFRDFVMRRGMMRTINRLIEMELIKI